MRKARISSSRPSLVGSALLFTELRSASGEVLVSMSVQVYREPQPCARRRKVHGVWFNRGALGDLRRVSQVCAEKVAKARPCVTAGLNIRSGRTA